jgi:YjbE family integral membrane protein
VVLRIIFTIFIVELLRVPYLKFVGGLILLWIATKLIADAHSDDGDTIVAGETLFHAVRTVVVADVAMSIDNVLAISAIAADNMVLLAIGVAISIPFVVAGASLIMNVLTRFPILVWAGGALLGWVSGSMIAEEPAAAALLGGVTRFDILLGAAGAAFVVLAARFLQSRAHRAAAGGPHGPEAPP